MPVRAADTSEAIVGQIRPEVIDFDPENPRNESEDEIFADEDFVRLQDSVTKHGVIVPLIVTPSREHRDRYVLIDGERRLRAAIGANKSLVPVRIVPEASADALAQSFQIHSLRKQWGPTAYVRATMRLIERLKEEDPTVVRHPEELRSKVAKLTGLSGESLDRYVRTALRYSEKQLDEVAQGDLKISYLWEIEESFIEQLRSRYSGLLRRVGERTVRRRMLDKARRGVLAGTRGLRPLQALIVEAEEGPARRRLERLLEEFVETPAMSPDDVIARFEAEFPPIEDDLLERARIAEGHAKELLIVLKGLGLRQIAASYPGEAKALVKVLRQLRIRLQRLVPKGTR